MYINVEALNVKSSEELKKILDTLETSPIPHDDLSCGYNTVNIVYRCPKHNLQKIRQHWRNANVYCNIVSI
jgi:hypothetical protein